MAYEYRLSLDLGLKTLVCAIGLYHVFVRHRRLLGPMGPFVCHSEV